MARARPRHEKLAWRCLQDLRTWCDQWSTRVFRERQLLLRTDGRVHYVFLTIRLQKIVAGVLVAGFLVALVAGGRLAYQSYLVHKGRAQIAELRARNDNLANALRSAAAVREAERRVAERVRSLRSELQVETQRFHRVLAQSGLDIEDIIPGDLVARADVLPAAGRSTAVTASYALELADLEQTMVAWAALRQVVQSIPMARPTDDGRLTSGFGVRQHPITGRRSMHRGVDISGLLRTPIHAPAPGVVTFVGTKGGFGKFVEIDHGRGFKTRYGHLHKILVRRGQQLDYRDKVALVGNSGRSTGPHLHYEVMFRGRTIDPESVFLAGYHLFRD